MTELVNPNPSPEPDFNLDKVPIDVALGQRRAVVGQVINGLGDSPDDAARAQQLSRATGVPGEVINTDLPTFEAQHKATLASQIVMNNPWLRDYVAQHPIGASVSNDDWGQLDETSRAVNQIGDKSVVATSMDHYHEELRQRYEGRMRFGSAIVHGFAEGFGPEGPGSWIPDRPRSLEAAEAEGPTGDVKRALELLEFNALRVVGSPIELGFRAFGGLFNAGAEGYKELLKQQGVPADQAERIGNETNEFLQMALMHAGSTGLHVPPELNELARNANRTATRVKPYFDAKVEPPMGVDRLVDQMHVAQSKVDVDNLKNALTIAQKSATRERDPTLFADFVRQHTDATIGISSDAIRRLYGESTPMADDGLLGWVPGIEDQMIGTAATEGDIRVPLADWLAKVDPKVAEELHDHIRVRGNGLTLEEAKTWKPKEEVDEPLPKAEEQKPTEVNTLAQRIEDEPDAGQRGLNVVDATRAAGGLEPLWTFGEKKVMLQKVSQGTGRFANVHDFDLVTEDGKRVGDVQLTYDEAKKDLHVEYIRASSSGEGGQPNFMGPSATRGILRQLQKEFPEARTISGERVSGAREAVGKATDFDTAHVSMPLSNAHKILPDLMDRPTTHINDQGEFSDLTNNVKIVPKFELTQNEQGVVKAVNDVLSKMAPRLRRDVPGLQKGVTDVARLHVGGVRSGGAFVSFKDALPFILWSHESADAVGTARHEVIHHLRQMGFFSKEEWEGLKDAAIKGNWIEKHGIKGRYKNVGAGLMLEEAVAEEFKSWQRDNYSVARDRWEGPDGKAFEPHSPIDKVMLKLSRLYVSIRSAVKDFLGYQPDFNDLFHRVETGEIGSRRGVEPLDPRAYKDPRAQMLEELERIKSAAYKIDDQVFTGAIHSDAVESAMKALGASKEIDLIDKQSGANLSERLRTHTRMRGFVTTTGRFVERKEAEEIARKADQVKEEASERLNGINAEDLKTSAQRLGDQPELPGMTRLEDRDIFEKANAVGMTVKQYRQVMDLIAKRNAEDMEFAKKQNEKQVAARQTLEWKENAKRIRGEVRESLGNRLDVQADAFLREGMLYGEKIKGRPRLDVDQLSDEQKAALPPDYYSKGGLHPDDVARLHGYHDSDAMIDHVSALLRDRGDLGPREYFNKMVEAEVDWRMQLEHGDLAKNILDEAQDHVISQTQFDLLHEQTLMMATLAGKEISLSKADVKSMVKQQFDRLLMDGQSVETHLRDSLKAANLAERAYADGDYAEAFKQQQKQYFSTLMANEAKALAKQRKKFDRNMKLMSSREVPSVLQEYTDFVHQIMIQIRYGVKRSVQDLAEGIERSGFKNLEDFWDKKTNPTLPDPREMPIADFLMDPKYKKNVDQMNVAEWRAVHESIETMIHNGRDEKKIIKAGEKADLEKTKKDLIAQLATLPDREIHLNEPLSRKITKPFRVLGARLLQLESLFNRWDRGDPKGLFNSVFSYPASSAGNEFATLTRKYSKEVANLKRFEVDLNKPIANNLFIEPNSIGASGGEYPMQMTRRNLRAVMLNIGNKSNLDKLARGYNLKPEAVMAWVHSIADKSDWDFAQAVGNIWGKIFDDAGKMIESMSGLPPERIPLDKIQTKFGEYDGWYHKIDYDPTRPGTSKALIGRDPNEQLNYARATTPRSWEKQRTGYAAPMSLQLDNLPRLMGQVLRDVAFRPFIHEASKLFYDKDFRMAVNRHYGHEYTDLLMPYLQDLGSQRNVNTKLGATVDKWIEFSRQNAISTFIGMNIHTVGKHGFSAALNSVAEVGLQNFAREVAGLWSTDPKIGKSNWNFALERSEELQRRHQQWIGTLGGAHEEAIEQGGGKFSQARSAMIRWGAKPVAFFDLLSAVPTFLAEYRNQLALGENEGTAIDLGNRAVRRAHGSTAITSRPEAMRGGALGRTLTSLYGFFNQMLQRQYEMGWRAKDAIGSFKQGDYEAGKAHIPKIALLLVSSVIFPAIVEEMISGHHGDQKENWATRAGKGVLGEVSSSLPVVRDIVHAMINQQDPSVGLINTPFKAMQDFGMDVTRGSKSFDRQHAGTTAKHFTTMFGMLTGLANNELGNLAKFAVDTKTGQQRPKGAEEVFRGMTTGNVRERK